MNGVQRLDTHLSMSGRLAPEQVVRVLNRYLGIRVEVIETYQGTIDEFIGDAIFILFGAPTQREDDAERAVTCAISSWQGVANRHANYHTAMTPPSSTMVVPLIYDESSPARKTATLPTSAGRASRCNGVRAISCTVLAASRNA